jgi:hypothetical protein
MIRGPIWTAFAAHLAGLRAAQRAGQRAGHMTVTTVGTDILRVKFDTPGPRASAAALALPKFAAVADSASGHNRCLSGHSKPRHDFVYASAERSRLYWIPVYPQISTRGPSHVEGFIMPLRRMVARRANAYRVQSSELRSSVNEFVTKFVHRTRNRGVGKTQPKPTVCRGSTASLP